MFADKTPQKRFTPLRVWAMSLGCCVGWGAFVMPGTTFLPMAGPMGSTIALFLGAVAMVVIGANYHFMAQRYPGSGGAFSYVRAVLGADHAFLCAWFLWLVYAAIIWANSTAFALLVRNFAGSALQFGFHYDIAGYDVYLGELLLTATCVTGLGALCIWRNRLAILLNTVFAIMLALGVIACFCGVLANAGGLGDLHPAFAPVKNPILQIFNVMALAPWAYVGFEAVSNVSGEMGRERNWLSWLMGGGVLAAALIYVLLTLIAAVPLKGVTDWTAFSLWAGEGNPSALRARMVDMPVFLAVQTYLGTPGMVALGLAVISGVATGVLGFYLALSRLTYNIAREGMLPRWFAGKNARNIPQNAIVFIMGVSLLISLLGRTAIGWIVDIATVGATLAYFYISVCTLMQASQEGERLYYYTGLAGVVLSAALCAFIFVPNFWSITALATESYLIFATWGVVGFALLFMIFRGDNTERYGRSSFAWIAMLFVVFFTSLMWMRQDVHDATSQIVTTISDFYHVRAVSAEQGTQPDPDDADNEDSAFLTQQMETFNHRLITHSLFQMLLIMVCIGVVFAVYSLMHTRRRRVELEKYRAEEVSRSKSIFLSNMSHDIRTPMNAIVGFADLALMKDDIAATHDYLRKIKLSSNHLLSLINDVLEMSRIESGKLDLHPSVVHLPTLLHDLHTIIIGQVESKKHQLDINAIGVRNENIVCDKLRLNQILLNLLSNAIKYTPEGGRISVNLRQTASEGGFGVYLLSVKDNGMGMSPDFAAHIFEAFEREHTTTASKIQGTGLGMAITKHLVDRMDGTIELHTEKGKGTEFVLQFRFPVQADDGSTAPLPELKGMRVLVVDDDPLACEAISDILRTLKMSVMTATSGNEGVRLFADTLKQGEPFRVCVLDWTIPDMSGVDVAQEIRDIAGATPPAFVLATAYDWLDIRDKALAAGITTFCSKPLFTSELRDALMTALGKPPVARAPVDAGKGADFTGKRVLLVDDLDINREIAVAMLTAHGIAVEEAADGTEAVEMVRKVPAGYYNAVLMDVQMPGMNGYDATRAIRALPNAEQAHVPVIAMTGNAFEEDRLAALGAGMNAHISKPIDMNKLFAVLRDIL